MMYKCKPLQELHVFENTKLISAQLYKSLDRKIRHDHFRKDRQTSLEVCLKNSCNSLSFEISEGHYRIRTFEE